MRIINDLDDDRFKNSEAYETLSPKIKPFYRKCVPDEYLKSLENKYGSLDEAFKKEYQGRMDSINEDEN